MSNDLKHALGDRPNSEFVIGPDGTIVRMRDWSDPLTLRKDLEELIGSVRNPTDPRSLRLNIDNARTVIARGVVDRINRPAGLSPIHYQAVKGRNPLYVKLRPEADRNLLRGRAGKLLLAFHIDPIYRVHWNNLNDPLHIEIEPTGKMTATPAEADGPKPKPKADIDPREFLIEVDPRGATELKVTAWYFACDDAGTWCKPVKQEFVVSLQTNRDAGRPFGGGRGRGQR